MGKRASGYRLSPGCRLPIRHKKMICIIVLCPIGEEVLLSSFREFVHDGFCPVRSPSLCVQGKLLFSTFLTRNKRMNYWWLEKNVWDAISRSWRYCVGVRLKFWRRSRVPKKGSRDDYITTILQRLRRQISLDYYTIPPATHATIQFAPRIFCFWRITVINNRKFKKLRLRESKISNSFTRQNNKFARASRFFVHFFAVDCATTRENAEFHVLWRTWTSNDKIHSLLELGNGW